MTKNKGAIEMRKEMMKEVNFGKATARIKVTAVVEDKIADGQKYGEEVVAKSKVEIVAPNGTVVTSATKAQNIGERTIVGDAGTDGSEVAKEINNTISEMKEEILEQENEGDEIEHVEVAKKIVEEAEEQGIENLMSESELKEWKKGYNDFVNEGSEGYVPNKITKEQYKRALRVVEINRYMTPSEASFKWGVNLDTLKNKLKPSLNKVEIEYMEKQGYIKSFVEPKRKNRSWIISNDAMEKWFGNK